eukprot:419962_1
MGTNTQTLPMTSTNSAYLGDDGTKMLMQFVYGLHYVKDKKLSKYSMGQIDYPQRHPWLREPSKHGIRGLFGVPENSHACNVYMEPIGFDPDNALPLDEHNVLEAIAFLSVFEHKHRIRDIA